ncbi:S8 family serine peptidase [Pontibacter saemangeumensis]|uniref:S8 family serine peptidase n=1 Tax=Pontibacter saemangeumensis TaxID=1084525 RepID=UPI0031E8C8C9
MKKNILPYLTCIIFLFVFSSCRQDGPAPIRNVKAGPKLLRAQAGGSFTNYTYISNRQQRNLGNVYTKQVLVSFANGLSAAQEQAVLAQYGFVKHGAGQVAMSTGLLHRVELTDGLNCNQVEQALQELAGDPNINYAAPYFMDGERLIGVSNQVLVTLEKGDRGELQKLAEQYNAEVLNASVDGKYILKVDKSSEGNALALANFLQGKKGIALAEPDFVLSLNR